MTIYQDTREKKGFSKTDTWAGICVEIVTMKTADYSNDSGLLLERKSVSDICNSCGKQKKRFYKECERGFDYLIIEGSEAEIARHLKKVRSRMSVKYIMKCLKEIHELFGANVIMCNNREHAAEIALELLSE